MARDSQWDVPRLDADVREAIRRRQALVVRTQVMVWVVSAQLVSPRVHYLGSLNQPCRIWFGEAACPHCEAALPVRTQHWLTVQDAACSARPMLTCLTPGAVESCPRLAADAGPLCGAKLRIWRVPANVRGAMLASLWRAPAPPLIWRAPDTLVVLRSIWEGGARRLAPPPPHIYRPDDESAAEGGGS